MPGELTEITELATALGMLAPDLASAVARRPEELRNVSDAAWERLVDAYAQGGHTDTPEVGFWTAADLARRSS